MLKKQYRAITFAILAAVLYAVSTPFSKLLLKEIPSALMASLLYLGAGSGMLVTGLINHSKKSYKVEDKLTIKELPYTILMILLDIAAPILLMTGLKLAAPANVSLLNNFEIVATSLIALLIFNESVGRRLWYAIFLITLSSIILSVDDISSFSFSFGSIFVILACICWGLENNCTRKLSIKDPLEIVVVKGLGSGTGSLIIALLMHEKAGSFYYVISALLLGFFSYGLGILFYIYAQRDLGAAKTSAYYAVSPFIGTGLSLIIFKNIPKPSFIIALIIMIAGAYLASTEKHSHPHFHPSMTHEHVHSHNDGHHNHTHENNFTGEHSHIHTHDELTHSHNHTQDIHHCHTH